MLPLMLMLVADPPVTVVQSLVPFLAEPPTVRTIDADATTRSVHQAVDAAQRDCRNGAFQQAGNGVAVARPNARATADDLMFRQGDPISITLLLERRIGHCSAPISYDLTTPEGALPSFPARSE
jgi:hypothetical protein